MTINEAHRNIRPRSSGLSALAPEMGIEIFEKVMQPNVEEAGQSRLPLTPEEAARASARAMANLHSVNKEFRNWALLTRNLHKDAGMAATCNAIKNFADLDNEAFRQRIASLLSENDHIRVDFSMLSLRQGRILLAELCRDTISHLRHVDMNMPSSNIHMQEVIDALRHMSSHHPDLHIGLNLKDKGINVEEAKDLAAVLPHCKVTALNLAHNNFGKEGAKAIVAALPPSITHLDLSGDNLGDEGAKAIAAALPPSMTHLDLSKNNIGVEGAEAIAAALPPSMTHLDLSKNRIGNAGGKAIAKAAAHPQSELSDLDLSINDISEVEDIAAALRESNNQLTNLNLAENGLGPNGAAVLAASLPHPHSKLAKLNLSDNDIGDLGIAALAAELRHSKLTDLDVSSNRISVAGIADIASALPYSKQLVSLHLACNALGSGGAAILADVLPHSGVTNLDLCFNNINDEGAVALTDALLHPQSKLTELLLDDSGIGDDGAIAIVNALSDAPLTCLRLSGGKMSDASAIAIANSLPGSKLIKVELSCTAIGDHGAIAIADALQKQESKVTELLLYGNKIGDQGAKAIADALPESPVTHLDLSENKIGGRGISAIANSIARSKVSLLNVTDNHRINLAFGGALIEARKNEPGIGNRALVHAITEYLATKEDGEIIFAA